MPPAPITVCIVAEMTGLLSITVTTAACRIADFASNLIQIMNKLLAIGLTGLLSCLPIAAPAKTLILSGIASWYSPESSGRVTASGEAYTGKSHTCAMRYLPLGTRVRILRIVGHLRLWSWCRVNDRGPYVADRIIDLSPVVRDDLRIKGLAYVQVYTEG